MRISEEGIVEGRERVWQVWRLGRVVREVREMSRLGGEKGTDVMRVL